jgi:hypothetical protein|tara:strand:- start:941 stop:1597 length:657 start_codon:yes stop_codon:yes gene_type:complete
MGGRKVCLVGYSSYTREWANEQEPDVEVWGINECHHFLKQYSRWYQMHPRTWKESLAVSKNVELPRNCWGRDPGHVVFLQSCGVPLYMRQAYSDLPSSIEYPLLEILDRFGHYLTSTPAFSLAHALYEHLEGDEISEIRMAGIELGVGTEYYHQRPCMEYLLGWARGLGIEIKLPPKGCSLLSAPLYSYDTEEDMPVSGLNGKILGIQPRSDRVKIYG